MFTKAQSVICGIVAGTSIAMAQQVSDDLIRSSVASFCSAISIPFTSDLQIIRIVSPVTGKPKIAATFGSSTFGIDNRSGYVSIYTNEAVASKLRSASVTHLAPVSENIIMAESTRIATIFGGNRSWQVGRRELVRFGGNRGSEWRVRLDEVVGGSKTSGNGNLISLQFDAGTKEIASATFILRKHYEPKTVNLSQQQAVDRASALLDFLDPSLRGQVRSVNLRYSAPLKGFGNSEFATEVASDLVYYVYAVRFDRCVVHISTRTGKSHGGIRLPRRRT